MPINIKRVSWDFVTENCFGSLRPISTVKISHCSASFSDSAQFPFTRQFSFSSEIFARFLLFRYPAYGTSLEICRRDPLFKRMNLTRAKFPPGVGEIGGKIV